MNVVMHCRISKKRWGGQESDYHDVHELIDSTKVLCSDSRHRILHTLWGVQNVVVPILGDTLINSDGVAVNTKDLCERDHLLVDYHNRFIPTLNDFVVTMDDNQLPGFAKKIEQFHIDYVRDSKISKIMLSPLAATGQLKSLLLTHNSWFINSIIPRITQTAPLITDFSIAPDLFFNAMSFEHWMDNGVSYPPSAKKMEQLKIKKQKETLHV